MSPLNRDPGQLQQLSIRPAAETSPVPYVRQAQPQPNTTVSDFLQGLGKLSPQVEELGRLMQTPDPVANKNDEARAQLDAMSFGNTTESIQKLIAGSAGKSEAYRNRLQLQLGQAAGLQAKQDAQAAAMSGDPDSMDPGKVTSAAAKKYAGILSDPHAARGFNEGMSGVGETLAGAQVKAQADNANTQAGTDADAAGDTPEALRKLIEANPQGSPMYLKGLRYRLGQAIGAKVRQDAAMAAATGDPTKMDPSALIAAATKDNGADLKDPTAQRGFQEGLGDLQGQLTAAQGKAQAAQLNSQRDGLVASTFKSELDKAMTAAPGDPDAALKRATQLAKEDHDFLAMSYADQGDILEGVAKQYAAQGNTAALNALGKFDRGQGVTLAQSMGSQFDVMQKSAENATKQDARLQANNVLQDAQSDAYDGSYKPEVYEKKLQPFIDMGVVSPGTPTQLRRMNDATNHRNLAAQEQVAHEMAHDQAITSNTPAVVDSLMSGNAAAVDDIEFDYWHGKKVKVERKDMLKAGFDAASDMVQKHIAQTMKESGEDDPAVIQDAQRAAVINLYSQNGEVDPLAQRHAQAFMNAADSDGKLSAADATNGLDMVRLYHTAPNMLESMIQKEPQRRFVKAFVGAMDSQVDIGQAIQIARMRRDQAGDVQPMSRDDRQTAINSVKATLADGPDTWGTWGPLGLPSRVRKIVGARDPDVDGNGATISGNALVDGTIGNLVDQWSAAGLTGSNLTDAVAKSFQSSHLFYNGAYVDIRGTRKPAAFVQPMFDAAAEALKAAKPAYADQAITFHPTAPRGTTFMAFTQTGMPIPGSMVTYEQMKHLRRQAMRASEANALKQQQSDQATDQQLNNAWDQAHTLPSGDQ